MRVNLKYVDYGNPNKQRIASLFKKIFGTDCEVEINPENWEDSDEVLYYAFYLLLGDKIPDIISDNPEEYDIKLKELRSYVVKKAQYILNTLIMDLESISKSENE